LAYAKKLKIQEDAEEELNRTDGKKQLVAHILETS
jgi:hypothetical protein